MESGSGSEPALPNGAGSCTIQQVSDLDGRRPDLKDRTRSGTVRWFDEEHGFGRITADDGEVLFVALQLDRR
jgi:hypothetical protein